MALLSGEVETIAALPDDTPAGPFRMALLSGEVETLVDVGFLFPWLPVFRMALLSGEVETKGDASKVQGVLSLGSGWLCYPGKLKQQIEFQSAGEQPRSGWLCYPGKLKPPHPAPHGRHCRQHVPDGFAIRGS